MRRRWRAGCGGAECASSRRARLRRWSGSDPAALEIRAHYLLNDCFLPVDALQGWGDALRDVDVGPVALVHGEADATCDPANTHWLAGLWPDVLVNRVPDAGHRMSDPRLAPLLRETAQRWAGALCARW